MAHAAITTLAPDLKEARDREGVLCAIEEKDAAGFVFSARREGELAMVFDNVEQLKARGMYERALLIAYTVCKHNNHKWQIGALEWMFRKADRALLQEAGDPFPVSGPMTLYRGVNGCGANRKVRGLSWTSSLDMACWFALRSRRSGAAVYTSTVQADEVFAYLVGEDEYIVRPQRCRRLSLTVDELEAGRQRVIDAQGAEGPGANMVCLF